MTDQFLFAIKLADASRFDAMLREVAGSVLEHAGYPPSDVTDILSSFRSALEQGAGEGVRECDVQFRADGGQLVITVSYAGGRQWRIARPLPAD